MKRWRALCLQDLPFVDIEVICTDKSVHQHRVETRQTSIANLTLPTWQKVQEREYQPWDQKVTKLDTAHKTVQQSVDELINLAQNMELPSIQDDNLG